MDANERRRKAARRALRAFQQDKREEQGVTKEAITDLITDLYLLAISKGFAMEAVSFCVGQHVEEEA